MADDGVSWTWRHRAEPSESPADPEAWDRVSGIESTPLSDSELRAFRQITSGLSGDRAATTGPVQARLMPWVLLAACVTGVAMWITLGWWFAAVAGVGGSVAVDLVARRRMRRGRRGD